MPGIFTVGHSNLSSAEFVNVVRSVGIELVVDVRKLRGSARYPQFDAATLGASLAEAGITLEPSPALTGRRPVSRVVPFEVNAWWTNRSFHNYADHALGDDFRRALDALVASSSEVTCAVMCAEALWWRCHRRIIADHVLARGVAVDHLMGPGRTVKAELSAGAVVGDDSLVTYPPSPAD